jgi:hypothetical protein
MTVLLVLVYPVLMVIREKMVQLYPVLLEQQERQELRVPPVLLVSGFRA